MTIVVDSKMVTSVTPSLCPSHYIRILASQKEGGQICTHNFSIYSIFQNLSQGHIDLQGTLGM